MPPAANGSNLALAAITLTLQVSYIILGLPTILKSPVIGKVNRHFGDQDLSFWQGFLYDAANANPSNQ